jgi:hypothetical protein
VVFYEFCKTATYTHEIIELLKGGGSWSFVLGSLRNQKPSHKGPCQVPTVTGRWLRHVPTGGEVAGVEGPVWHDQQGVGNRLGEVGLDGQRWSPAGGEEGRWPWRRVTVPSGRPVNVTI